MVLNLLDQLESPELLHSDAAAYPAGQLDELISAGILRETARATRIPRPARFGPGPELIVRETARGLHGVAEEGEYFDPLPLTDDDVRQYEVSLPKLVDRLRKENGITGNGFENDSGLIPLGTKRQSGSEAVWAYLSLPNSDEAAVLGRCARLHAPSVRQNAVILVPNGPAFSAEARRVLGEICVLSLGDAAESGTLALDWTPVLTSGRTAGAGIARVFRLDGQIWTLAFDGKTVRLPDAKGLSYICQLLRRPGHLTEATELMAAPGAPAIRSMALGSAGSILDDTAISQYKSRLAELRSEIGDAERDNDLGRKETLENEQEQIKSQLRSATGLGGRRRRSNDDAEKVRKAVSNAISRAITAVRKHHRPLADHLQRFIDCGQQLYYTGDGTPWNF